MSLARCIRAAVAAAAAFGAVSLDSSGRAAAQEAKAAAPKETFEIAGGAYRLTVPEGWERREPKSRIVEHEFAIKPIEGDKEECRITVMGAGGSIEDNIARWAAQFKQPDGSATTEQMTVKKSTSPDREVHTVDIAGTYVDRPPFAGQGVDRPGYRMLAAIIVTKKGNYFIKVTGPIRTMTFHEAKFKELIASLMPN